ncbi:MAG: 50S ribosomal protein L5 [Candidatus Micrarchaeia archaeon]
MANSNENIVLEKVSVNIGLGQSEQLFDNAKALLKKLTNHNAAATRARKRDPSLKLRKGQVIGAMVTIRGQEAAELLKRAMDANGNNIKNSSITSNSLSFGIKEYIDFAGLKYDPKIGMLGMNINASFARKGRRVERRRRRRALAGKVHRTVGKEEIIDYLKKNFNANIISE